MGWITLPRNLLEAEFDSLGLEVHFETGVPDGDEVANTERLSDYCDDRSRPEDALEGPDLPTRGRFAPIPQGACPGSRQPVGGDTRLTNSSVICSVCGSRTYVYLRRLGVYKCSHPLPTVSEGTITVTTPSKTN